MVVCKFFQQGNCRYGNTCRFEHMYSSKYSYRAPQLQSNTEQVVSSGHGLNSTASSVFRNAVQNIPSFENASSYTLVKSQSQKPSVFDRLGPRYSSFGNQNNDARSVFAQANQNVFGQTQPATTVFQSHNQTATNVFQIQNQTATNIFQSQNHTAAKSLFAKASQSMFGQDQSSPNIQTSWPNSNNTSYGNVFQITSKPTSNVFATGNNYDNNDEDIYSKMDDLSQSDKEAFESADFKFGFVPELPPPQILCI